MSWIRGLPSLAVASILLVLCTCALAQDAPLSVNTVARSCAQDQNAPKITSSRTNIVKEDIKLWQGIVLLLCFGAFALFICLIHRIIRTYIYYDAHLLDTFFDGGGDINVGLVACAVVAKYVWSTAFTISTGGVIRYGLVGHFWFAAALAVQIFLFAIVAAEIRIKAPGAKTFLQVIRARYGAAAHIIMIIFSLIVNILVVGIVMMEGTQSLTLLTEGMSKEVTCIVLAIVIGFYTVVGGVGGTTYVAYFVCALIVSIMMVFLTDVFWDPLDRGGNLFANLTNAQLYNTLSCAMPDIDNEELSGLTFISKNGMLEGVLFVVGGFGLVFVNQSFWQTGISAKPNHGVWGFLTAGLTFFAIPFCFAFAFGIAYWILLINTGTHHLITENELRNGSAVIWLAQEMWGNTGSFLYFVLVMVATIATASGEVLSASSIIVYDIYQSYIAPFRTAPIPENKQVTLRMQRAIRNEEYLEYDRRCVVLKHVVVISVTCLLIPITLVLLAIDIDAWWLFFFTGILVNSCVLPVGLAITWHRITGPGVISGMLVGLICGVVSWLVYASVGFDEGLNDWRANTGKYYPLLVGLSVALGVGGLVCVIVSLSCGGCDGDLQEEEEWEKTRTIDNPILPWSVKYAPDIGPTNMKKGRPHFFIVRRTFKLSEIVAYILGVLLAVCAVLVWPALMLTADIFDEDLFNIWKWVVLIVGIVATAYIILIPFLWETIQTCMQAFYNRQWARSDQRERLEEEPSSEIDTPKRTPTPPPMEPPAPQPDQVSQRSSDFNSTMGRSSNNIPGNIPGKERWKTFITFD